MSLKSITFAALVALAQARFGQEQCQPALGDIQAVTSGGKPGQAATIAGGAISTLLAASNTCEMLKTADSVIQQLGTGADAIKAAQEFANCEHNFNPFVQAIPNVCDDPTLPVSAQLRGILPKIDPSVGGADVANKLAAQSLTTPFDATGLSVADVFAANGFKNFTRQSSAGATSPAGAAGTAGAGAATPAAAKSADTSAPADACVADPAPATTAAAAPATTMATMVASSAAPAATDSAAGSADATSSGGASITNTISSIAGDDFGKCNPGMKFESGLGGRPATEFTFQAADPKISAIQEEALNFNIIANRICDELTNQCESNAAAKATCASAKTAIANLGRVRSTADKWNTLLGFAGQNTNPDNKSTAGEPTA